MSSNNSVSASQDTPRTKLIEMVSRLFTLSQEASRRALPEQATVATAEYWRGVSFGLQMAVGEVLTVIEILDKGASSGQESKAPAE